MKSVSVISCILLLFCTATMAQTPIETCLWELLRAKLQKSKKATASSYANG